MYVECKKKKKPKQTTKQKHVHEMCGTTEPSNQTNRLGAQTVLWSGTLVRLSSLWLVGNENDNYSEKPSDLLCYFVLLKPGWWVVVFFWGGGLLQALYEAGAYGQALTPFELGWAPSPLERLRGGEARAGRAGCCCRLRWKAGTPCSECWTPPCLWASQELWSWSSDRSGDNGDAQSWDGHKCFVCEVLPAVHSCSRVADNPTRLTHWHIQFKTSIFFKLPSNKIKSQIRTKLALKLN